MSVSTLIKELCYEAGFIKCGFSKYEVPEKESQYLKNWIEEKRNADMKWIEKGYEKRKDISLVMTGIKSIISLAYLYDTPYRHDESKPKISRYAWGNDYHKIIKNKLKELCFKINQLSPGIETKFYVDDGPVMEKFWAQKSGIGWQGKHTIILNHQIGSFFFLSEILINIDLDYDSPAEDLCSTCSICVSACPTGALFEEYKLDANLCISYQTIESREETLPEMNYENWIFGCDICQDVCPYNKKKFFTEDNNFEPKMEIFNKTKDELINMTEEKFDKLFFQSPVKRTKYKGWLRNLKKI